MQIHDGSRFVSEFGVVTVDPHLRLIRRDRAALQDSAHVEKGLRASDARARKVFLGAKLRPDRTSDSAHSPHEPKIQDGVHRRAVHPSGHSAALEGLAKKTHRSTRLRSAEILGTLGGHPDDPGPLARREFRGTPRTRAISKGIHTKPPEAIDPVPDDLPSHTHPARDLREPLTLPSCQQDPCAHRHAVFALAPAGDAPHPRPGEGA